MKNLVILILLLFTLNATSQDYSFKLKVFYPIAEMGYYPMMYFGDSYIHDFYYDYFYLHFWYYDIPITYFWNDFLYVSAYWYNWFYYNNYHPYDYYMYDYNYSNYYGHRNNYYHSYFTPIIKKPIKVEPEKRFLYKKSVKEMEYNKAANVYKKQNYSIDKLNYNIPTKSDHSQFIRRSYNNQPVKKSYISTPKSDYSTPSRQNYNQSIRKSTNIQSKIRK